MSLICVPIIVHDLAQGLETARRAHSLGADLVEYRIDECFTGSGAEHERRLVINLVAQSPIPCIVTCRTFSEGGRYEGDDVERVDLYERLGASPGVDELPPRYIDCELASYLASPAVKAKVNNAVQFGKARSDQAASLILSIHDFQTRPADLTRRLLAAQLEPAAAIIKVAYRARSLRDSLEILDLPRESTKPIIALGMGECGIMSRVLAPKFGGFLTFASLDPKTATAPGQPTLQELLELFRFRSINAQTQVFGIVGWPIGHSLSPLVHNAGFKAVGENAVYIPLPIAGSEHAETSYISFKATMLELLGHERLDFSGCSVTAPHKANLLRLAVEQEWVVDPIALMVGAANTLVVHELDGTIQVLNTDIAAAINAILTKLPTLQGASAGVIGAGGAGRAIAFGLAQAGAHVVVFNRTKATAQKVVTELTAKFPHSNFAAADLTELPRCCCDVFVNCTPMGMKGGPDEKNSVIPVESMGKCKPTPIVFDTVYNPIDTPLLIRAREHGWQTIDGVSMFVTQAEAQFKAFTGTAPPAGLFDQLTRAKLAEAH